MGQPVLRAESLLMSKRVGKLTYEPFCVFHADNFLPADVYERLRQRFPTDSWFQNETYGNKRYFSSHHHRTLFEDFCRSDPLWRDLFDGLRSRIFVRDLKRVVWRGLFRSRGPRGLKVWRDAAPGASFLARKLIQPIRLEFQFSRMGRGTYILPHTDSGAKLVSLLLYFADPRWRTEYGGGTQFYCPKNSALEENWSNEKATYEDVTPFETKAFVPNRLVVFLKSKNSYHGVPPVDCPEGMTRDSLNFNIDIRRPPSRAPSEEQ